jgi:hypothetical protein
MKVSCETADSQLVKFWKRNLRNTQFEVISRGNGQGCDIMHAQCLLPEAVGLSSPSTWSCMARMYGNYMSELEFGY